MIQPTPPPASIAPPSGTFAKSSETPKASTNDARTFAAFVAGDRTKGPVTENPPSGDDDVPDDKMVQLADLQTDGVQIEDLKTAPISQPETTRQTTHQDIILATEIAVPFKANTGPTDAQTPVQTGKASHTVETLIGPPEKSDQSGPIGRDDRGQAMAKNMKQGLPSEPKPSNTVITLQTAATAQGAPNPDKTMSLLERAIAQTHAPQKATITAPETPTVRPVKDVTPENTQRPVIPASKAHQQTGIIAPTPETTALQAPNPEVKTVQSSQLKQQKVVTTTDMKPPLDAAKTPIKTAPVAQSAPQKVEQDALHIQPKPLSKGDLAEGYQRTDAIVSHLDRASGALATVHTTPTPPPSVDQARLIAQQLAQAMPTSTPGTTEITLSPEELGRVRMSITLNDGAMTLTIQADRPETSDLMRRHIDQLAQTYKQLGFTDLTFNFDDAPQDRSDTTPQGDTAADDIIADDSLTKQPEAAAPLATNGRLDLRI